MSKKTLNVLKYVFAACLTAFLIYLALKEISWDIFIDAFQETRWSYVLLSLACAFLALVARNERWRLIMVPINPQVSRKTLWDASNIGNLVSLGVPWVSFFVRCGAATDKKTPYDKTIGSIFMEKTWDMVMVVVLVVLAVALNSSDIASWLLENVAKKIAGKFTTGLILILLALIVAGIGFIYLTNKLKDKYPIFKQIADWIDGILEGFKAFGKIHHKTEFILLTIFIWLAYIMMCFWIFKAIPILSSLNFTDALFISAVGNLSAILPVPGGFGAYHYFVAIALSSLYGSSWEIGILFATLTHETRSLMLVVLGAISMITSQKRIKL